MASAVELVARARVAWDVVSRDAKARQKFIAHYWGTRDAITSLQDAAAGATPDALEREQVESLRLTAFGRTRNAAEEAAAVEAQCLLRDVQLRRKRETDALDYAIAAITAAADGAPEHTGIDSISEDSTLPVQHRPRGTRRVTWLIPLTALSLAIGYASSNTTEAGTTSGTTPNTAGGAGSASESTQAGSALKGDPVGANAWFENPQIERDRIDAPALLTDLGIVPSTTRFVQVHAGESRLWIARTVDGEYCVLGLRPESGGAFGTCIPVDEFAQLGLRMTNGYDIIEWDGNLFTTSTSRDSRVRAAPWCSGRRAGWFVHRTTESAIA